MSSSLPSQDFGSGPLSAVRIVRQHVHDVRNHLNGLELGATLIGELAGEDEDIGSTVSQIHRNLALLEVCLKSLVQQFTQESRPGEEKEDQNVTVIEIAGPAGNPPPCPPDFLEEMKDLVRRYGGKLDYGQAPESWQWRMGLSFPDPVSRQPEETV